MQKRFSQNIPPGPSPREMLPRIRAIQMQDFSLELASSARVDMGALVTFRHRQGMPMLICPAGHGSQVG